MNSIFQKTPIIVKVPLSDDVINLSHKVASFKAPLAEAIISLSHKLTSSFHALPISGGWSLERSLLKNKYEELFGTQMLRSEMTVTGPHFDSFFLVTT